MALIADRKDVPGIYSEAEHNQWVLPCFCIENLTSTEAVLAATKEYGDSKGMEDLPVIVARVIRILFLTGLKAVLTNTFNCITICITIRVLYAV